MPPDAPAPAIPAVLGALVGADVRFVVVGAHTTGQPLRLVVSRHPTSLAALNAALDALGSTLRTAETAAPGGAGTGTGPEKGPRRVGDELGTVAVRVGDLDVDLYFGGARQSLYAETVERSDERVIGGITVRWAPAPAELGRGPHVTSRSVSRRLRALAERLGDIVERDEAPERDDDAPEGGGPET